MPIFLFFFLFFFTILRKRWCDICRWLVAFADVRFSIFGVYVCVYLVIFAFLRLSLYVTFRWFRFVYLTFYHSFLSISIGNCFFFLWNEACTPCCATPHHITLTCRFFVVNINIIVVVVVIFIIIWMSKCKAVTAKPMLIQPIRLHNFSF